MSFEPKIDPDTGETFYGFTHEEAVFITGLMSTGSELPLVDVITEYIQMGHLFVPQQMVNDVLDGYTLVLDRGLSGSVTVWSYHVWHSDRKLYCFFRQKMYMRDYSESVKDELLAVYEDETTTDEEKIAAIELLMANTNPAERVGQRAVFFDNKKRMLYIDGKYYPTTYIKRRNEDE